VRNSPSPLGHAHPHRRSLQFFTLYGKGICDSFDLPRFLKLSDYATQPPRRALIRPTFSSTFSLGNVCLLVFTPDTRSDVDTGVRAAFSFFEPFQCGTPCPTFRPRSHILRRVFTVILIWGRSFWSRVGEAPRLSTLAAHTHLRAFRPDPPVQFFDQRRWNTFPHASPHDKNCSRGLL